MEARSNSQMARLHMKLQTDEKSRVFARLADELRLSGHVEDALELLQQGIQFHPDYSSGHVILGKCYLDLGALEEAAQRYQRALELDSRNADIQKVVEKLRSQHGDHPPVEPEDQRPPMAQASVSEEQPSQTQGPEPSSLDEEELVAEPVAELTELSPEETELLQEGEGDEAGKGPPRGMATATLAEIYVQQGLVEKAIETYKKVLRHLPEDQVIKDRLRELRAMRSSKTRRKQPSRNRPLRIPKPSVDQKTDIPPEAGDQGAG